MKSTVRLDEIRDIPDMSITETDVYGPDGQPLDQDSWQPQDLGELGDKPPIQPTLGAGITYPGKRHVFSGPQESAKTLAAYAIGLEVVRNNHSIIVIDFEMGAWDARTRLQELGTTRDEFRHIHYIAPDQPATENRIARLLELAPELVIIDAAAGAYDIQGLDDNKRADVEKFTRIYVRAFWLLGIATIVLDHVVKNPEGRGRYAIGSERKVGGTDVHLGFEAVIPIKRGEKGTYKITTHKDRGGYLQRGHLVDLHLDSDPETHHITWTFTKVEHTEKFRPTELMKRVSAHLQFQDEPLSFTQVKGQVKGEDSFIAVALERLIEEGYATETQGERNARLVTHKTLFTDQPTPLRPFIHAENEETAAQTAENSQKQPQMTPADPCVTPAAQASTTPASPSKDAGDAGDALVTTPAPAFNVYDPKVQAYFDDKDIPF